MNVEEIKAQIYKYRKRVTLNLDDFYYAKGYCYGLLNTVSITNEEYDECSRLIDSLFDNRENENMTQDKSHKPKTIEIKLKREEFNKLLEVNQSAQVIFCDDTFRCLTGYSLIADNERENENERDII